MKRNSFLILGMLLNLLSFNAVASEQTAQSVRTVTYTADNTSIFPNPERGFYEEVEWRGTDNLDDYYFEEGTQKGRSLLMRLYYFENYRTTDLPQSVLTQIGNDMAKFRQKGFKCILRFAYTDSSKKPYQDASPAIWKRHLEQLKPVLQQNSDVIYVVQAGFLGVWGEWYYSNQGIGYKVPAATRTALINALLDAVPANRCVQLRTPKFKTDYIGSATALTDATAYKGTPQARLGHHNDAFCNGELNQGTYENATKDKAYIAQECLYVPNGGETNIEAEYAAEYKNYGTGAKATAEMKKLHYSYLGFDYAEYATGQWKKETDATGMSYYNVMARDMGYRFQLTEGTFPATATTGGTMSVTLKIKNTGYAPLYNERHAYIVLKNTDNNTYRIQLQSDPRSWHPDQTTTITENLTLPANIAEGTYTLYLNLPDADSRIATNPAFSVRFANTNIWEQSTGYNKLNTQITISKNGGGDTPQPEEKFSITFNDNQPSPWDADNFVLTASGIAVAEIEKGQTYIIPAATPSVGEKREPDYIIYEFVGWNTQKDGTGTMYQAGDQISVTGNTTLYAQWKGRDFDITYYADKTQSETLTLTPNTYAYDREVIFPTPTPTRNGYDFVAWHSIWDDGIVTSTKGYWGDFMIWAEWKTKVGTNTENSTVCRSAAKRVENGQILIERNGNTYNAIGERIR